MPVRRVIEIDEDLCNGCGLCVGACHEGAIALVDGKARLMRDDFCDGIGDCLPSCPQGAIEFVTREAVAYDEQAVEAHLQERAANNVASAEATDVDVVSAPAEKISQLKNWPVQIKLAPISARYFDGVNLLVAADCTAFAYADFQNKFLRGRVCLVGCPKLDSVDYTEKLAAIIEGNDIKSVTMLRMSVPCCGGLEAATRRAIEASGKIVPLAVAVISTDGELVSVS